MKRSMIRICVVLLLTQPVIAGVHFGSKKSGLMVSGSATLDLGFGQSLQAGVVRNSGGIIHADALDCADMNFENTVQGETRSLLINGTLTLGADEGNAILLHDGDALIVAGETIALPVTAQSGTSVITGYGGFDLDIVVNPGATVRLAWDGILNTDITFMAGDGDQEALVVLEKDLYLGTRCELFVDEDGPCPNRINFNGHTLFVGGDEESAMLRFFLACSRANIQLRGPVETFANFFVFLDGPAYIHGGGHVYWINEHGVFLNEAEILDEEGAETGLHYPVTFEDITLRNIWCGLFQGGEYWNFINTTCESGDLSITLNGILLGSSPSPLAGDTTFGGATIDLNSDLTNSSGMWFFNENGFIEGDGHCIDASQWRFSIDTNKQLTLRNVVLKNFDSNSFVGDGTIRLSHVTFELDEPVDLSTGPLLSIDGPVTFFTGPNTVTVRAGSSIVNSTVLYDTSGTGDAENIIGFNDTEGRLKYVDLGFSSSVDVRITENFVMDQDEYLYPNINGALARTVTFVKEDSVIAYDGRGHCIMLPFITSELLAVGGSHAAIFVGEDSADTTVVMENVTMEGFKSAFFSYNRSGSNIFWGNNVTLKLQQNLVGEWALTRDIIFGTSISGRTELMCLDLQNYTMDCDGHSVVVQGTSTEAVLRIKNGRLINPLFDHVNTKIILDSVELVLEGDTPFGGAVMDIEGHCTISGEPGSVFRWLSAGNFTLTSGATLRITDGITFCHDNDGESNFVMEGSASCLELIGATFQRKIFDSETPPLTLKTGQLIVDHTSTLNLGNSGIEFGNGNPIENLGIEIRPGATLRITGTGSLLYNNTY